jgi:hypothetical protein
MSDFRISIEVSGEGEWELDWGQTDKRWTLSEREDSEGYWELGKSPNSKQLKAILDFFRILPTQVNEAEILEIGPGELTLIHQNNTFPPSLYSVLCDECGKHWLVFRWDGDKNLWLCYGRNCYYSWYRGCELTDHQVRLLGITRGYHQAPLAPPR